MVPGVVFFWLYQKSDIYLFIYLLLIHAEERVFFHLLWKIVDFPSDMRHITRSVQLFILIFPHTSFESIIIILFASQPLRLHAKRYWSDVTLGSLPSLGLLCTVSLAEFKCKASFVTCEDAPTLKAIARITVQMRQRLMQCNWCVFLKNNKNQVVCGLWLFCFDLAVTSLIQSILTNLYV